MNKEEMIKRQHEMMFGRWGLVSEDEYNEMKKKAEELAEENARLKQNKAYTESPLVMLIDYLKRIDELEKRLLSYKLSLQRLNLMCVQLVIHSGNKRS